MILLNTPYSVNLEVHDTKDIESKRINGSLTVIWRDWDNILKNPPKMMYLTSVNPREIKGPHLHSLRTSYFTCVEGKVMIIVQDSDGNYQEIESSSEKPNLICIPKNFASAHINISSNISKILVLADIAWKPGDNEMKNVEFENYDWNKWNA